MFLSLLTRFMIKSAATYFNFYSNKFNSLSKLAKYDDIFVVFDTLLFIAIWVINNNFIQLF